MIGGKEIESADYEQRRPIGRRSRLHGFRVITAALCVVVSLAWALVLILGSPAQAAATRSGTLQATVFDDFRNDHSVTRYTLRSGGRERVVRPTRLAAEPGDRVAVTGQIREGRLVGEVEATSEGDEAVAPGPREVAVLLVRFPGDPTTPWSPEQTRSKVFTGSTSVDAFYREESYGDIWLTGKIDPEGDVFGWFSLGDPGAGCQYTTWQQEADQAASEDGIDLTDYEHIVYAFPHRSSCSWAGIAGVNGTRSSLNGNVSAKVVAHELGHNLGLHHSGSWTCTTGGVRVQISDNCTTQEYGDPFDTMGNIAYRHNNGWHLAKVGILVPENVQTISVSGTYSLRSALSPTAEPTVLRVPRTRRPDKSVSSWYYLEIREQGGIFENVTDASIGGVSIRATAEHGSPETLLLDANPWTSHFFDAPLEAGETFDGGPVQIRALDAGGGSASVEVDVDTEPPSAPTDLQASVEADGVRLSWVSADNVGVERYFVFRDGEQIRNTTTESIVDRRPPAGDREYIVVAEDASLNQSDPSEPLTVTVPFVSGPTCSEGKCKLAYRYSGAAAEWIVPPGVHDAFLTVEGANGGGGPAPARVGGGGARIWATLEPLTAGQVVDISVGGEGRIYSDGGAGGFNGGGDGGLGGGGGGYTSVELESTLEILAAGGGGGGLGGFFGGHGGTAEDQGSPGGNGALTSAQGATLRGGNGGAAGGDGGAGGAGGGVTGSSSCPGGTQDGLGGESGESFAGGGGVANAGGGGGGGYVGGGQGGGGATDACGATAASGGGGSGSSYVAPGRLDGFGSVGLGGDDGWLSIEYDNPIVAAAHSYTTGPNQQLNVEATSGVLSGASGPGDDPLAASEVTPPGHGSLTLNGDGSFTYTPDSGYLGSDSFAYEVTEPFSDNYAIAEATVTVAEPPVAAISAPADGATYVQGQAVNASFACAEGPGGPGISSCTGPVANGKAIDTSATGDYTFTVVATSEDGLTSQASATYTVEAPAPGPEPVPAPEPEPEPSPDLPSPPDPSLSISIGAESAPVVDRRVEIPLGCTGTAPAVCRGTLSLRGKQVVHRRRWVSRKPIVLGRVRYAIPAGQSRLIGVRLSKAAFALLKRSRHHRLRAEAIATLRGGSGRLRPIILEREPRWVLVGYRRFGGLGGGDIRLLVAKSGRALLTTPYGTRRASLDRRTRARLARALRRARLARLRPSYEPAIPTPDAFTHVVTYRGHTVRAVDTAAPPRLRTVIDILNRVANKLASLQAEPSS